MIASILANDESQAGDDLSLGKKLVDENAILAREVRVEAKQIVRKDGRGTMEILPGARYRRRAWQDEIFIGFDEIWAYRNHDLFEAACARSDAAGRADMDHRLTRAFVTLREFRFTTICKLASAATIRACSSRGSAAISPPIRHSPTAPQKSALIPSMAGWDNPDYLTQQRRRLPTHKYRRLHLNLPGAPDGAAFDGDAVMAAIVSGRKRLPRENGMRYVGFVDMSGGSSDDAVLAIAHRDANTKRTVLDLLECQTGHPPFSPRTAVKKFAGLLKEYGQSRVIGDAYAGQTFRQDFAEHEITYSVSPLCKSDIYDEFEPKLNAGEIELLDIGKLQEQLLTLVIRGAKIDHQPGDHDDFANAAAGAIVNANGKADWLRNITPEMLTRASHPNSRADQLVHSASGTYSDALLQRAGNPISSPFWSSSR